MNKIENWLLLYFIVISNVLFGQENNNAAELQLRNKFIIFIFEINVQDDSTLQIRQKVYNTNYDRSVYIRPVSLCRNPGVLLPGDTNDLLIISDYRLNSFFDLVDCVEIYKIPPKGSRVFYDKYKFSNINKIKWVNIKTNYVFETSEFNDHISFVKDVEGVDSRNRPTKTSVFFVDRKLFNRNSDFSEVFCSGIDLLKNRIKQTE